MDEDRREKALAGLDEAMVLAIQKLAGMGITAVFLRETTDDEFRIICPESLESGMLIRQAVAYFERQETQHRC